MKLIEMTKISKIYNRGKKNEFAALKHIDFSVEEGEMIAIQGSSGAGKSTLLHIIGCLDSQTEGEYFFQGNCVQNMNQQQKAVLRNSEIGFVLQDFGLLEYQNVLDAVSLPLLFANRISVLKMKEYSLSFLEKVGLQGYAYKKISDLSGGEKQRVAIARALVNNPSLILADEPTGALDSTMSQEIMNLFYQLGKQGKTIIIVTHDSKIAQRCGSIIKMSDGKIVS